MSGVGFDHAQAVDLVRVALAVLLTGGVIRLMDDFLDLRYDILEGTETLAVRLGEGTLPYSLIGFVFAVLLDPPTASSLMVGAYAVGMAGDLDRQLPSGLRGYQEGIVVLASASLLLPWQHLAWATAAMLSVQALDDLHDLAPDRQSGNPNLARRFGIVEAKMTALAALLVAAPIRPLSTALVFVSIPVVDWVSKTVARPMVGTRGWAR